MSEKIEKLTRLQDRIEKLKMEKVRAEQELRTLEEQQKELIVELQQFGVLDPSQLNSIIPAMELELETEVRELEQTIQQAEATLGK